MSVAEHLEPMSDSDRADLDERRKWAYSFPGFFGEVDTPAGKLQLIETILRDERSLKSGRYPLQCLGVVLGDAVAQEKGMSWFMLVADGSRAPCLGLVGTPIRIVTITIIANQVTAGQPVHIQDMFDYFCRSIDRLKADYEREKS